MAKKRAKVEAKPKTSVKFYQGTIEAEKQAMSAYSKKFGSTVRGLQADFKKHAKDLKDAAMAMREEGIKKMNTNVGKYKGDIKDQIKENKEAIKHMGDAVKYFINQINGKKREFRAYTKGPFSEYIKAFWGV